MTLEDIKAMTKETLTPAEVADILCVNPHWIRVAARDKPELLGFPVIRYGSRTKIPRRAFIKFMEGQK